VRFGSLFTGIGGIDLGLERAGMTCEYQVEVDDRCQRVLSRHWPDTKRHGDIRDCGSLPYVPVLAGGFPCQDISSANINETGGITGPKSGLWAEFARVIYQMEPEYVIIENVEALRYRRGGLGTVLGDLADIGYDAEWRVLQAKWFGAPHRRARTWLVAYAHGQGQPDSAVNAKMGVLSQFHPSVQRWPDPPARVRVDDGIPDRMDRLRQLGNSVVPHMAEFVGRCVMAHAVYSYQRRIEQ
jgi:DNA (cytosine-5)-methyltransferase 1